MPDHHDTSPSSHPALSYADGLANSGRDLLLLIARVAVGWIYMQSGWAKLMDIPGFAATMGRRGLPEVMGYIAPPVEFFGGVMILAGVGTRYAALLILLFTIIASFSSHAFWAYPQSLPSAPGKPNPERAMHFTHFWKNMTMKGGLLLLFITGAGKYSLDALLRRKLPQR